MTRSTLALAVRARELPRKRKSIPDDERATWERLTAHLKPYVADLRYLPNALVQFRSGS